MFEREEEKPEETARRWLSNFLFRLQRHGVSIKAMDVARRLEEGPRSSFSNSPSDMRCLLMDVGRILTASGPPGTPEVVLARLTRRVKSTEASWPRISEETGIPQSDCKRIVREAIPRFVAEIRARGLAELMERTEPPR